LEFNTHVESKLETEEDNVHRINAIDLLNVPDTHTHTQAYTRARVIFHSKHISVVCYET